MPFKIKLFTAFKIWLVIYPSITLFLYLFGESLMAIPLYLRTLILTLTLVPWIVFVGVPFLNWVISKFSKRS